VTQTFLHHYHQERPNQARTCGNRPPRVACPDFPTRPSAPQTVDPDLWLERLNKPAFARTVQADGGVTINHQEYYRGREFAGHRVTCFVNAVHKQLDVWYATRGIKQWPLKGLYGKPVPFEEDVALMKQEARSEYRRYLQTHPRLTQGRLWA